MKRSWAIIALAVALSAMLLGRATAVAHADGTASPEHRELAIERSLACPQCTDLPLDVCNEDICNDMRAIIQQKVLAGESDAAIRQYFVERYGSRVLLAPPKSSVNLLAWIFPFAAILLGGVLTAIFIRSARHRPAYHAASGSDSAVLASYRSQVERDVEELE